VLQRVAMCVLQRVIASILPPEQQDKIDMSHGSRKDAATHCNTHIATRCNTLQHTTAHCNTDMSHGSRKNRC